MDLVTLVERARGGDVGSFTELVQRHQRLAHGSAMAVVHDPDVAKDVAQEAFVALHAIRARRLESLAEAEHLPGEGPSADLTEADALDGHENPDASARATVARARRLRRFFAQPFFIAEPYTHRPGTFVPRADTLAACTAILDGVHDDVPEDAFYFAGGIDEVLARARGAG